MSLRSKVRRAADKGSYVGTILSYSNGVASISLGGNGSILTNVPVVGNTGIGSSVTVTYISGNPIAYSAGAVDASQQPELRTLVMNENQENNTIAGWTIEEGSLYSSNGNVFLDSATPAVRIGSATNYMTGTGIWMGLHSAAYKLHIGNPSGEYMAWTSTSLTLSGSMQSTDFSSGTTGWRIQSNGDAEFNNVTVRGEIRSAVFTKAYIQSLYGSLIISKASAILVTGFTSSGSFAFTVRVPGTAPFASGDIIRFKNGAGDNWGTVGSPTDNGNGTFTYTFTRTSGSNTAFEEGLAVVDYGPSGSGFLYMTADDANGPYYSVVTHAGSPWTTQTTKSRIGNLNGSYGIGGAQYGAGIGDYASGNYLLYDGSAFKLRAGSGSVDIDSNGISLVDPGTAMWFKRSGSTIGRITSSYLNNGGNPETLLRIESGTIGTEMLSNTGFESGTTGWTLNQSTRSSTYARSGSWSIFLAVYGLFDYSNIISDFITASAGTTYRLSCYIKITDTASSSGANISVIIAWYNSSDTLIGTSSQDVDNGSITQGWIYALVQATAPTNTAKCKVEIDLDLGGTPIEALEMYCDDVSLVQVTTSTYLEQYCLGSTRYTRFSDSVYVDTDIRLAGGIHVGSQASDPAVGEIHTTGDARFAGGLYVGSTGTDPATGEIVSTSHMKPGGELIGSSHGRLTGGIYIGGTGTTPTTGVVQATSHGLFGGGIYAGNSSLAPSAGEIRYTGSIISVKNGGTNYTGCIFVPLTTPLTSTSFDGDVFSDVSPTLIDLSAAFGVPAGVKAVLIGLIAKDTATWGTGGLYLAVGPSATYFYHVATRPAGNGVDVEQVAPCPCDANGDIYYSINASGTNTLTAYIRILGYWI